MPCLAGRGGEGVSERLCMNSDVLKGKGCLL